MNNLILGNKGFKSSQCQKFFTDPSEKIENEIYCKECITCHECNRQEPRRPESFIYLEDSLMKSKKLELKKEMIAYIKKYFKTNIKKGDNNDKEIFFQTQKYPYLTLKDYSGYIIGYNHPIIKSKLKIDPKTYKITQQQANKYLIEDLDQYERELYEFYLRQKIMPEVIPENIRMLLLFVLFIFKDFYLVLNLAKLQTYNNLYVEIKNYRYPEGQKILKGKVQKALDFFNNRFHRRDGSVREQTVIPSLRRE